MKTPKQMLVNWRYRIKYRACHLKLEKGASIYGRCSTFEAYNRIGRESTFSGKMGYGSYIGKNSHLNATIGRYCCISDRVHTVSGTHPASKFVSVHPSFYSVQKQSGFSYVHENWFQETLVNPVDGKTSVYIGNDVWIGCDVTLLGGIQIGDGAIIAAGAVVNTDVEPYTVVGGVPAKPIRKRFREDQIAFLQEFRWWEKDPSWLREYVSLFQNVEDLMGRYSK